ncbi:hypothetical protein B0H19DRAFT_1257868 [Mycena capillaripes]|nr:hypothetical protein B0H19DRAFT_1257868 [Mycena capillaripes]
MPSLKEGEKLEPAKYPDLFEMFRASARAILKGELTRTEKPSKMDAEKLTDQLIRWARFELLEGTSSGLERRYRPHPNDLDETDRVDQAISTDPATTPMFYRSSTHWAIQEYIRLDSAILGKVISSEKKSLQEITCQPAAAANAEENQDWDIED